MNDNLLHSRNQINEVLNSMKLERENKKDHKAYKTLVDTLLMLHGVNFDLTKFPPIVIQTLKKGSSMVEFGEKLKQDDLLFYKNTGELVSQEIDGVVLQMSNSLEKREYREHRDWTISYEKLLKISDSVKRAINRYK